LSNDFSTLNIRRVSTLKLNHPKSLRKVQKSSLGQNVEIIVLGEESVRGIQPGPGNWESALKAVEELEDYDFDAVQRQAT
jgi:hypothetical protein